MQLTLEQTYLLRRLSQLHRHHFPRHTLPIAGREEIATPLYRQGLLSFNYSTAPVSMEITIRGRETVYAIAWRRRKGIR